MPSVSGRISGGANWISYDLPVRRNHGERRIAVKYELVRGRFKIPLQCFTVRLFSQFIIKMVAFPISSALSMRPNTLSCVGLQICDPVSEGALSGQYPVGSIPLSGLFPMYEYGLIDWLFAGLEMIGSTLRNLPSR